MSAVRALRATYRLQLHKDFTFDDAREIVPYLARLGVSHAYTSPVLRARPGSTHGYDVADPTGANPELGGEEARSRFVAALERATLGWLLDIVPNHMGTGPANPFWEDVLTHGASSRYGHWFDIGWRAPGQPLVGRVLLPVLGDRLRAVLDRGELGIAVGDDGRLRISYFDDSFPVDPRTYPLVLALALGTGSRRGGRNARRSAPLAGLARISDALAALPAHDDRGGVPDRDRGALAEAPLHELEALYRRSRAVRQRIAAAARAFPRGAKGRARMHQLVDAQPYRLAFWRRAARLVNYRRFFDINELVALRMEDERVFAETHARILEWVRAGDVTGLRIDHIDGLLDPLGYLERLRAAVPPPRGAAPPFPIVVEKILSPGERLREEWPVQGTTGYEYLNDLEALFLDPGGARRIGDAYSSSLLPRGLRSRSSEFQEVAIRGKLRILGSSLSADVRRLAALLHPIAQRDRRVARLPRARLAAVLTEWLACFPVYRTYLDARSEPAAADREVVDRVAARCRERGRLPEPVVRFLRDVMLDASAPDRDERLRVVARLQQTSGPATAKGVEDTALYQYVPLASLNEVGGEPDRDLAGSVARFHEGNGERARCWGQNLLCTNTHDTKRSADVRARLDVLTEIPDRWVDAVRRWRRMNADHRRGDDASVDANTEYLLYQTLVGVWPLASEEGPAVPDRAALGELRERIAKYMEKAVREGKLRSSWTDPDEKFERALKAFIGALLPERGAAKSRFLRELGAIVAEVARPGLWNSLARVVGHLASPGTPDLYQGDELWNFTLVDPDNRRLVDFSRRAALLDELASRQKRSEELWPFVRDLASRPEDDRLKLWLTWRMLEARRAHESLFTTGEYVPLAVEGPGADHVVAFARRTDTSSAIALVGRHLRTFGGSSRDLPPLSSWNGSALLLPPSLAGTRWLCAITGRTARALRHGSGSRVAVDELLAGFPAALLLGEANATVGA